MFLVRKNIISDGLYGILFIIRTVSFYLYNDGVTVIALALPKYMKHIFTNTEKHMIKKKLNYY